MASCASAAAAHSIHPLKISASSSPTRVLAAARRSLSTFSLPSLTPPPSLRWVAATVVHFSQPRQSRTRAHGSSLSARCFSALSPELKSALDKVVKSHKVLLFMKGTKDFPQCGFSNTVVQILKSLNVPFETYNILENEMVRQGLKEYSSWPTFPQLYVDGEFFGGCDITVEAYKNGQLQELLEKVICS